jgi:hypothetical protein
VKQLVKGRGKKILACTMTICNMKTILDWNHNVIEDKVKHQIYAVCAIFPGNGFAWYQSLYR